MALTSRIHLSVTAQETLPGDLASASAPVDYTRQLALGNGTGANQADLIFTDERTLGPSASELLDLAGTLVSAFGQTLTFAKVKAIVIEADAGNTHDVLIQRTATIGAPVFLAGNDGVAIPPGGLFVFAAPGLAGVATVTPSSGDLLTVSNSGGGSSVTYRAILIGTSV